MINKLLLENDILIQTKKHLLPIVYAITNSVFLLEVLLLLYYVNSSVNLGQGILYERVMLFYNIVIISLFVFIYILTPIFSAGSIAKIYNDQKLINLIISQISKEDIVLEKIALGIMNDLFSIITCLPIAYVSLFFGGISLVKILKILLILFEFIVLYNCICVLVSAYNYNVLISYIINYLIGLILTIFILLFLTTLIANNIFLLIFTLLTIIISFILYIFTVNSNIFNNC